MKLLDVVRATLRTTFRPRFELRVPRFFFDLRFVAAKVAADYAESRWIWKSEIRFQHSRRLSSGSLPDYRPTHLRTSALLRQAVEQPASGLCPPVTGRALRAAHVGTGAGVDLDGFAFLDEERHVNGLAGFQLCRFGDITRSIAAQTFR